MRQRKIIYKTGKQNWVVCVWGGGGPRVLTSPFLLPFTHLLPFKVLTSLFQLIAGVGNKWDPQNAQYTHSVHYPRASGTFAVTLPADFSDGPLGLGTAPFTDCENVQDRTTVCPRCCC